MIDSKSNIVELQPRRVRLAPKSLGLYVRAGRNDHLELTNYFSGLGGGYTGVVVDGVYADRHRQLRELVTEKRLELILDPKTQAAATIGGFNRGLSSLPWIGHEPETASDYQAAAGKEKIESLADYVAEFGFSEVLAPTHLIESAEDDWVRIDVENTFRLREALDARDLTNVGLIFPLTMRGSMFRSEIQRLRTVRELAPLDIDAVWLRVDNFGGDTPPSTIVKYIKSASDFHALGVLIIGDSLGGLIGHSVMAFGAVGGLSHGVTYGQRFSTYNWRKPRSGKGFMPAHRIYFPDVDLTVSKKEAEIMMGFSLRAKGLLACKDQHCCPRGADDMLLKPGRHFLRRAAAEVSMLSAVPRDLRPRELLEKRLRPASDRAVKLANLDWKEPKIQKRARSTQKRLDDLRVGLSEFADVYEHRSSSAAPAPRVERESRLHS